MDTKAPSQSLIQLIKDDKEKVAAAVAAETAPYKVLNRLNIGGKPNKARQLCDAILYYGWDTNHWETPLVGEPLVDWDNIPDQPNCHGSKGNEVGHNFECRVASRIQSLLEGHSDYPYQTYCENEIAFLSEELTKLLGKAVNLSPWDGAVWFPTLNRLLLIEAKATSTSNSRRTTRHQLHKRKTEMELLKDQGVKVIPLVIMGLDSTTSLTKRVLLAHDMGGWSGGLNELQYEHLVSAEPHTLVALPVEHWQRKRERSRLVLSYV